MTTVSILLIKDMQERQRLSISDLINPWLDVFLKIIKRINQESRHGWGGGGGVCVCKGKRLISRCGGDEIYIS